MTDSEKLVYNLRKIEQNHRLRRVLLFFLVVVMLVFTGLVIDGRIWGNGPLAQAQVIATATQTPTSKHLDQPFELGSYDQAPILTPPIASQTQLSAPIPVQVTISPIVTGTTDSLNNPSLPGQNSVDSNIETEPGTIFLSMNEGGFHHLFAYHPQYLPFTRLTDGDWDDITPAPSPNGKHLAFASNRDGYWDLYLLDLTSGLISRLTNTTEYDGSPSWSPDNQWLAYETYTTTLQLAAPAEPPSGTASDSQDPSNQTLISVQNLEIFIRQVTFGHPEKVESIRLTNDPAVDHSPTWSPTGRQIAFVSDRTGDDEVWLADLDQTQDRFVNITQNTSGDDNYPSWAPHGEALAWISSNEGYRNLYIQKLDQIDGGPQWVGSGDRPIWSPEGHVLYSSLSTPNKTYLTGYLVDQPGLVLPPIELNGDLAGISWGAQKFSDNLVDPFTSIAKITPTPSWLPALTANGEVPNNRRQIVPIQDVQAPYPMLNDLVDESFVALREALQRLIGWDYLASLENAYLPLTTPLSPGMQEDWLYTGRAFALNTAPLNAGWLLAVREDYGSETYWRVYIKARFQDGSQGLPLRIKPWDFSARYSGDPMSYEYGGVVAGSTPPGYWVDFTQLAASYGWERLPALSTWRSSIPSSRYHEFAQKTGLDWEAAMMEIYPPEVIIRQAP